MYSEARRLYLCRGHPRQKVAEIATFFSDDLHPKAAAQTQPSQSHVNITLHQRSCVRALDKVIAMKEDAVHPAKIQHYLFLWAAWWSRVASPIYTSDCLKRWVKKAQAKRPAIAWLGVGLLSAYRTPALACA